MKASSAGGVDGLRPDMYKVLMQSEVCVEALTEGCRKIVEEGNVPEEWKHSKTVMIPKSKNPTVADLRPIALTNVSYKMMMRIVKKKIECHLKENGMRREEQMGFTKGGEVVDNLLILRECVRNTYSGRQELVIIAVDFKKAYDSVKREVVVDALKDYKVPEKVIDMMVSLYVGDKTRVGWGKQEILIDIESGIRQGCTVSPLLFKLLTYRIIDEVRNKVDGVWIEGKKINSLFFADDGILLASSVRKAEEMVRVMRDAAGKMGLEMNHRKSKCMLYNVNEKVEEVG